MSGTSLDGLDGVLTKIEGHGLDMKATFVAMQSRAFGDLRNRLLKLTKGTPAPPIDYLRAARQLGELHADAVSHLCTDHLPDGARLDFVVAHGQTIWHAPDEHLSFQLLDPWPIVRCLDVPVCYDLRQADLIAAGQGAPITPLADWVMYRQRERHRLIVNLGGICNITLLPAGQGPDSIIGRDIGACNLLIDGVVQRLYPDLSFDRDGRIAAAGQVDDDLCNWMAGETHPSQFDPLRHETPSLGREKFNDQWLDDLLQRAPGRSLAADTVATAVNTVATMVTAAASILYDKLVTDTQSTADMDIVLAGGGANNPCLIDCIKASGDAAFTYLPSGNLGIPNEAREAHAFAILGALSQDRVPITLPQVTGARSPRCAGAWVYP